MISRFENLPMRLSFLFLLISSISFSQRWSYQGHNKTEKYGHEYWFSFQNEEDSNSYELTKFECIDSNPKFSVKLLDFYGEPIIPSYFTIKNIANDSLIFAFATDEKGEIKMEPDSGSYIFDLRTTFYDKFEVLIHFDGKNNLNLTAKLGLASDLQIYQINSKKKLVDSEVNSIIECVKNGIRHNPSYGCEKKKKYYISMHI